MDEQRDETHVETTEGGDVNIGSGGVGPVEPGEEFPEVGSGDEDAGQDGDDAEE